jgi:hypothetical protein
MQKLKNAKWSILALFIIVGLSFLSAYFEGYLNLILGAPKFLIFFAAVLLACIITALYMKTKFFIWLLVLGFCIGLLTQMVGTYNNLWIYKGTYKSYVFAGFSWAFAATTMLGLCFLIKKLFREIDRKVYNVLALIVLLLIIPIFLSELRTKVFLNFWIYHSALFIFGVVATYRLKFSMLLSLILAAWIMGIVSEYMGSSTGLWSFCPTPEGSEIARTIACWSPPPYLTFGCWPLEFITQIGLTSLISQVAIINVNVSEKAEDTKAKMRDYVFT